MYLIKELINQKDTFRVLHKSCLNKKEEKMFKIFLRQRKELYKWLLVDPDSEEANKQRERPPCFPQVEETLAGFEIDNFVASTGWIDKFKQRYHLKEYVKWGEAKSAPLEMLEEERRKLREIIKNYDLNDVFNCDETGLYWDLEPSKTLAKGPLSEKKKSKKWEELPVNYYWNSTAWMQVSIWNDYLMKLDTQMRLQHRNILLLVDNAPLCDAGIINSFKTQYRKLLVRNRVEAYEISQELNKAVIPLNIYDAINFSKDAWNAVSQQTIFHCWQHTKILPLGDLDETDNEIGGYDEQVVRDKLALQDLIYELPFNDLIDVNEFLHIDDCLKGDEGLTDDEIISMVKSNNDESKENLNEEPLEIISKKGALEYLDELIVFFEHSSDIPIDSNELIMLQKLRRQVLKSYVNNSKHITLDNFVQIL
ncbi:CENP-B homolog protein 2-like [Rhizophagus irregularis DAOM 181602=DAOM 197198]|nr:CENP-B homolog protein 2-like [Rhizophagus irregularis DAOM 181602=DAOM 197198]